MEFLYDQAPESMRSTATALYWIAIGIGNYLGTFMVTVVHKYSGKQRNWIADRNLNRGRLEYYYLLVSGIQLVNLIYYVVCAWMYTYKPLEKVKDDAEFGGNAKADASKLLIDGDGGNQEAELARK